MHDLDVLCLMAHPDDADILCGGTLAKLKDQGHAVGIVDFTRGEMGTRGTPEERATEAECAARILGVDVRVNLDLPDSRIRNTVENRDRVVRVLREYRPHMVITHAIENRNPDHTHTSQLVREACFTAGLAKHDTGQSHHRPNKIIFSTEYYESPPSFLVDISAQFERKMQAIDCFHSQTFNPEYDGPPTYIASDRFSRDIEARMRYYGARIHVDFAEGFSVDTPLEVDDIITEIALRGRIPGQGRRSLL